MEKKMREFVHSITEKNIKWMDVKVWFKRNAIFGAIGILIVEACLKTGAWWEIPIVLVVFPLVAVFLTWHTVEYTEKIIKLREEILFKKGYLQAHIDAAAKMKELLGVIKEASESVNEGKLNHLN